MDGLAYLSSPVGELEIHAEGDAITLVGFLHKSKKSQILTPVIQTCLQELTEYFKGERKHFEVKIELRGSPFQQQVWNKLLEIPYGKTTYYADIAAKVGDIHAAQAVGLANGQNPIAILVPCHRVIGKDGSLVGYGGGLDKKVWLLRHEGALNQLDLF
jgi:methylated-DNA-[protein]-cysteine S-methyltransferase